jgi:hypothetical protein
MVQSRVRERSGSIVLDFNYAYHPFCHYNPRWVCPLAPPQNRLDFAIPVGEMASQIPVMGATEF